MTYHCKTCGQVHTELPHIGDDRPAYYYGIPEAERERRVKLTGDTCVIDDEDYFIRGVIEIPVHGHPHEFGWGVWVTLKKENFEKYQANFDTPDIGPFFGWLSTEIDWYKPHTTINLKTMAHFRGEGLRPMIKLEPASDHPLAVDQRNGITLEKAWEIVHHYSKE
jgi:hypothetical protein